MGSRGRKTWLILLLVSIGGYLYFHQIRFDRPEQTYSIVTRTTVTTTSVATTTVTTTPITNRKMKMTRRLPSKQNLDFVALSDDLREYSLTRSEILEEKLFPWWLHGSTDNHSKQHHSENDTSKGIVICTGNQHFHLTLVALSSLALIGNELPIEVVYSTPNDLSAKNRQELEKSFPTTRLVDLSNTSIDDVYLKLRGWEIKPFAVLASQFRHVLLMDADVLFLEKPSVLFENSYYLKTGTLFFYDRPALSNKTIRWIETLLTKKNNQTLPQRTQESGVVLIDKARVLAALLSTCKLNDDQEREQVTYQHLHGDKDTWWLGFHLIEMPYSFIPTLTASIGQIIDTNQSKVVCGHILHLDEKYQPIWWNGGMFKNRYVNLQELLTIEGWLYEGQWTLLTYSCLTNIEQTAKQFTQKQQQLINGYRQITKMIFKINE